MKVTIRETKKNKSLILIDPKFGRDYAQEFIGNFNFHLTYDAATNSFLMSQEDYDWWSDVLATRAWTGRLEQLVRDAMPEDEGSEVLGVIAAALDGTDLDAFGVESFTDFFKEVIGEYGWWLKEYDDGSLALFKSHVDSAA